MWEIAALAKKGAAASLPPARSPSGHHSSHRWETPSPPHVEMRGCRRAGRDLAVPRRGRSDPCRSHAGGWREGTSRVAGPACAVDGWRQGSCGYGHLGIHDGIVSGGASGGGPSSRRPFGGEIWNSAMVGSLPSRKLVSVDCHYEMVPSP